MTLHEIGLKYGTDKTIHGYLPFYEEHLPSPHEFSLRFLEIGVGGGASLRMWREWLPKEVVVEGWDIEKKHPISGCVLKQVNQADRNQLIRAEGV